MARGEQKVTLELNTAITGIDRDNGRWNEQLHNHTVLPLRGLIMQIDGVFGCHINRYTIEVNYFTFVTDMATVVERVQAAVSKVAERDEFFPLRGEKAPLATPSEPEKSTYDKWWEARVTFSTDLYTEPGLGKRNEELIQKLSERLVAIDGARDPYVDQRLMYIRFDKNIASPEVMRAHMEKLAGEMVAERMSWSHFPFATEPTFSYRVYETAFVI